VVLSFSWLYSARLRTAGSCFHPQRAPIFPSTPAFYSAAVAVLLQLGVAGFGQAASRLPDAPSAVTATIAGTVLDTNGDVIEGARVRLTAQSGDAVRVVETGANGQFTFADLAAGVFKLTVSGQGMATYALPGIRVAAGEFRILSDVVLAVTATSSVTVNADPETIAEEEVQVEIQQRVLGVLPNFYTSYDWNAAPLGTKQKFELAFHAATDPVAFAGAAVLAGVQQANNTYSGYGQGLRGYGKRFGAAYGNDVISRMLSSAILPSLLHQDPRYFYKGTGTTMERARYAVMSTVICRGDNGRPQPNVSHLMGSFAAGAISNLYYPAGNRGAGLVIVNGFIEMAGNAGNNLLREFLFKRIGGQKDSGQRSAVSNY
jgi:hypothetical protein